MSRIRHFLIIFLSLFQGQAKASHLMGGEISYRYLGGLKYEVTCKLYRDCRGIPLNTPICSMIGNGDTSKKKLLSLTLISIRDVSNYCKKSGNPCYPKNTSSSLGIEEHLFKDTVDFNKADSAFKKYCSIKFGMGQCCRNGGITMTCNNDFWVFCELNICTAPKNSSPVLTTVPNNILCCNQPVYYNYGAIDTLDYDSLSFEWTDPLTDWTNSVTWCWGGSSMKPFSDYWPSGYDKKKGPDPSANPPIGTYLDPETGDLIFTPIVCSESSYAAIKVSEWRKDSTGKYAKIGEMGRDLEYHIITCPDNNVPALSGPYKQTVCANQKLCFTITSDDKQFVPPPPAKANPPDTVTIKWNYGISRGATFKIIDTTARLQKGQFCWTPKESDISDLPYTFTVTARDNNCPTNGITIKSYSVLVNKSAKATRSYKFIKNGLFEIKSVAEKGFKGTPNYFWEIMDSVMNPADTQAYFHSTGNFHSLKQTDSLQFYKGGKYIVHHRINNPPLNCPTDYFDTLKVPAVSPILRVYPTVLQQYWVCKNTIDTIFPVVKNAKNPVKYRWSSSNSDTLPYLVVNIKQSANYKVDVYDAAGYHRFAGWSFYVYQEPVLKMGNDTLACVGDTVSLSGTVFSYTDTVFWKWSFKGKQISTDSKIKVTSPGLYSLEISDSNQCVSKRDTMEVKNMIVKADLGPDIKLCINETLVLKASGLDTSNGMTGNYYWYMNSYGGMPFSINNQVQFKVSSNGRMIVELKQSNGTLVCSDLDTVEYSFRALPEVQLKNRTICQNETELDLQPLILKPTNSTKGIVSWILLKTLQRPGGKDNTINDLVYDKDTSFSDHYYLKADKLTIDLKTKFIDSIKLGLIYKDEFGCENSSSNDATIIVRSNVDLTFNRDEHQRCYGDSLAYISSDYGVNYFGGKWITNNDSSNYLKWPQGNNVQLSEKLRTKPLDSKGGKYLLKYTLENNKCLSLKNAILNIIPYPTISWTQSDKGDSILLTNTSTNAGAIEWYINSKKMSEANSLTVSKQDAKNKVIELRVFNANCESDSTIVPKVAGIFDNYEMLRLFISPNPVRGELLIETSLNKSFTIEIINNLGQIVLVKTFGHPNETINVSGLSDGIYSLILKTGNDILVQKFMKASD